MREIKFRAWDRDRRKMFEVEYMWGDGTKIGFIDIEVDSDGEPCLKQNTSTNFDFMQFTGLHDKNGVEIYDGDICKYWMDGRWKTGEIIWHLAGWAIHVTKYGADYLDVIFDFQSFIPTPVSHTTMQDQFEVIGNIYENPELIR